MKFFIDTANTDEIKKAWELGVIDGVTTNPSLMAKEGKDPLQVLKTICSIVSGPVNAEVVGLTADVMIKEAKALSRIHKNIVIKIPMIEEGLKAVKKLSSQGIKTNVTLIFSATQALLAAKAGASYVSPFVGRLDDISHDGMEIVGQIIDIYDNYLFETEIIVASVRNPLHVLDAAMMGADIATIPYSVIAQLAKHPLTDIGLQKFLKDWEKVPQKKAKEILSGKFTLTDMYDQFEAVRGMGPFRKVLKMLPGMSYDVPEDMLNTAEGRLDKWRVIIQSMTPSEKENPKLLNSSRARRIARGSGTTEKDVKELLKQYVMMRKMLKMFKRKKKLPFGLGGKGLPTGFK